MRAGGQDFFCAALHEGVRAADDGAARVDHVVDHDATFVADLSDDLKDLDLIRLGPFLCDNRERAAESVREILGTSNTGYVGADHDHVAVVFKPLVNEMTADNGTP